MPGTSKAVNPHGWTIEFDEATHRYTTKMRSNQLSDTGACVRGSGEFDPDDSDIAIIYYTSGTTFVHKFFPKFDADGAIAARKAKERNTTVEQIHFEWKQNAQLACEMGTRVHETCEDVLKNRVDLTGQYDFRNKPKDERERKIFSSGFQAATKVKETMTILGVEQIVFDLDCQLAGTIDLLTKDSSGTVWILDWKTNKTIDEHNNFKKDRFALSPISHLENCNFVQYSLQLNLYQYLMVKAGYFPRDTKFRRGIFHLTDNGPKFHEMPDLQIEIRDMVVYMLEQPPF